MTLMKHAGKFALLIALVGAIAVGVMLFGARFGFWEPIVGFGLYRTYLNPLGAILTGIGLLALVLHLIRKESSSAVAGGFAALIGLACLMPLIAGTLNPPLRAPPIHDISTDTVNPPVFEVLDETRAGAKNTLEYGGADLAAAQEAGYPDIAPLNTDLSPKEAFERALSVGRDMGWDIVASDAERLRFEATAHTPVFHFADDIVVVVTADGDGSRVDMRSVSRVGRGDQGVNAARIRTFQDRYAE
jgi:uncharacterized protein (DUF1499 family)